MASRASTKHERTKRFLEEVWTIRSGRLNLLHAAVSHSSLDGNLRMQPPPEHAAHQSSGPARDEGIARQHPHPNQYELAVPRVSRRPPKDEGELPQEHAGHSGSWPPGCQEPQDEAAD